MIVHLFVDCFGSPPWTEKQGRAAIRPLNWSCLGQTYKDLPEQDMVLGKP